MEQTAISVNNVTKIYKLYDKPSDRMKEALGFKINAREHYALKDVSFDIKRGETVGIIGTNGSGKSTILKIITGVLSATSGGTSVAGRISALLELGAGFNMEYTGVENVYLNGAMIGFSREEIDAKLDSILEFADIGDFVHQPVKSYSSGMFVRLAFAVAINIDPEILIVDEALSVGDVFFQAKCYRKFDEFKSLGKTILFVSHDLGSITKYCDRTILLNNGEKIFEGNPKAAVDMYKRLLVGQLPDAGDAGEAYDAPKKEPDTQKIARRTNSSKLWKDFLIQNPDLLEYGQKEAQIVDYAIWDDGGMITNTIIKGSRCTIGMRVKFNEPIAEPIFAFTIKNLQGIELTGTNTMFEKADVPAQDTGDTSETYFTQTVDLQGGEYLLSLGCTGYRDGDFHVYHRLYDVCSLTVVSEKNTTGYYDMNSKVEVRQL